jgi:ubiquinone/menaquinone biosynthesis C-methylase UbiE
MGNGRFEELCLGRGIDVYTLDPSEKSVQMLRKKLNLGSKAVAGYSQAIPFADSFFDGVVMTEVIEHLSHEIMEKTFSEIKRVLKTGGLFTGTIPNNEDLNADMTICPKCGEKFTKWGHLQTFTVESFRKEVEKTFSVLKVESRLFTPWNILNWHGKIEAVARYCMFRTGTLGERWQNIFFLCKK